VEKRSAIRFFIWEIKQKKTGKGEKKSPEVAMLLMRLPILKKLGESFGLVTMAEG
jgi:hypothetical protein